jgi:FdhE protein
MEYYSKLKPELVDLLALYRSLFEIESGYLEKMEVSVPELDDEKLAVRLKNNMPLLNTGDIGIDSGVFKDMLSDICGVIAKTNESFEESVEDLLKNPDLKESDGKKTPVLIQNALEFRTEYFTDLAKRIPLNNELMFFIIYHTTNPFIEKASYAYRDRIDYEKWQQPVCPVCGRKPSMAMLTDDDGLRILQCSTCKSWWSYPRKQCAICMTKDEDKLEYFYSTDDEAHLVYICNNCKKYIKTTDKRKLDREIDLDVEDLATIELDFIAKDRGYEPGGRVTFAIGPE